MKMLNKIICVCGAVIMPFSYEASALSEKQIITQNDAKGSKTEILGNTLWVRLKSAPNSATGVSALSNSIGKFKLEPILPSARIKSIQARINSGKIDNSSANSALYKSEEALLRTYILEYEEDMSPMEYIRNVLAKNPKIELAEPYYIYELQKSPTAPNDPLLYSQITFERMKVQQAWQAGLVGSPNTVIAISDNGVNTDHEDLAGNIGYNSDEIPNNGIDDDANGYVDDYAGYNFSYVNDGVDPDDVYHPDSHGTNVAGIAAATTDNEKGIAGVANQCKYFPLKVAFKTSGKVAFGYQSIIYAAENNIPVINCSWGRVKQFSQIEQDIITYAVSKGVAIVAASGNTGLTAERDDIFYPANYDGVLGVGEVNTEDQITVNNTTLSLQTKIMATGLHNVTCSNSANNNEYESLGVGTSYASPIIAGFLGLVRSKYPELTAREAIEFARLCTDNISGLNPGYTAFLPGRVNMLKAVEMSPMSIPSIRPTEVTYTDYQDKIIDRFTDMEQVINLNIKAYNYLGAAENLKFKLVFNGDAAGMEILNDEIGLTQIAAKSAVDLVGFKFRIKGEQPNFTSFKVVIYKDDQVIDFFTLPIACNNDVTSFENNKLIFSVSDYGRFGSSINSKVGVGNGFSPKGSFNMLHSTAGLMLCIDRTYPYSSVYGENLIGSDFTPLKRFASPDSSLGSVRLINDAGYAIVINSRYSFLDENSAVVKCEYEVESINEQAVNNLSVGLLFDWDMPPKVLENSTELFYEAVPEEAPLSGTAAQIVENYDGSEFIGTMAFSTEAGTIAQVAGMRGADITYNQSLIEILNNGTATQYVGTADIMTSAGMKFIGKLVPNTKRRFTVLIAYSNNKSELATMLKDAYKATAAVQTEDKINTNIYPNPAADKMFINSSQSGNSNSAITIYNATGELISSNLYEYSPVASDNPESQTIQLNISKLSKGAYLLLIDGVYSGSFIKK